MTIYIYIYRTCAFVFERTRTDDKSTPAFFRNVISVTRQVLHDKAGYLFSYFLSLAVSLKEKKDFLMKANKGQW